MVSGLLNSRRLPQTHLTHTSSVSHARGMLELHPMHLLVKWLKPEEMNIRFITCPLHAIKNLEPSNNELTRCVHVLELCQQKIIACCDISRAVIDCIVADGRCMNLLSNTQCVLITQGFLNVSAWNIGRRSPRLLAYNWFRSHQVVNTL